MGGSASGLGSADAEILFFAILSVLFCWAELVDGGNPVEVVEGLKGFVSKDESGGRPSGAANERPSLGVVCVSVGTVTTGLEAGVFLGGSNEGLFGVVLGFVSESTSFDVDFVDWGSGKSAFLDDVDGGGIFLGGSVSALGETVGGGTLGVSFAALEVFCCASNLAPLISTSDESLDVRESAPEDWLEELEVDSSELEPESSSGWAFFTCFEVVGGTAVDDSVEGGTTSTIFEDGGKTGDVAPAAAAGLKPTGVLRLARLGGAPIGGRPVAMGTGDGSTEGDLVSSFTKAISP